MSFSQQGFAKQVAQQVSCFFYKKQNWWVGGGGGGYSTGQICKIIFTTCLNMLVTDLCFYALILMSLGRVFHIIIGV